MSQFVNKHKIIEGSILEPYTREENYGWNDFSSTHGWQVVLIMGLNEDGYHHKIIIDKDNQNQCFDLLMELGLTCIS